MRATLVLAAAMAAAATLACTMPANAGPKIYLGVQGSLLQYSGDDFEGFGSSIGQSNSNFSSFSTNPDHGWGGRIWADVELNDRLLLRGSFNGAWFDRSEREDSSSLNSDFSATNKQKAELDAIWATLEGFYTWSFGRPARPHTRIGLGGGAEYAEVENTQRFGDTTFFDGEPFFDDQARQRSDFWGIGPRASAYIDHELGESGLHFFGEAGVAYLFGDRDTKFKVASGFSDGSSSFKDNDSDGGNVIHTNLRVGVGYDLPFAGFPPTRIEAGWSYDHFFDSNNVQFLPGNKDGDNNFGGPFLAVGIAFN
jgi:Legionella pneumophila major outer membrane protein precursor